MLYQKVEKKDILKGLKKYKKYVDPTHNKKVVVHYDIKRVVVQL